MMKFLYLLLIMGSFAIANDTQNDEEIIKNLDFFMTMEVLEMEDEMKDVVSAEKSSETGEEK